MFTAYITDGHYIQGKKVGQRKSLDAAYNMLERHLKKEMFKTPYNREAGDVCGEKVVWVDDATGFPVGIIICP